MDNIIRYSYKSSEGINFTCKLFYIFIFFLFLISVCLGRTCYAGLSIKEPPKVRLLIPNFVMKSGDIRFRVLRHSLPELLAISLITDENIEYVGQEDALRTIATEVGGGQLGTGIELLSDSKNLDILHIDFVLVGSFIEYKGAVSFDAILEDRRTKEKYSLSSRTVGLTQIYSEVEQFARSLNTKIGDIILAGAKTRIAVLCFKDISKMPLDTNRWMEEDIAAILSLSLEKNRELMVVPFTLAKKHCKEDKSRIVKIDFVNIDAIIDGTFFIEENKMTINPEFYIVGTGQLISLSRITGDLSKYYALSNRFAQSVSYALKAISSAKGTWNVEAFQFTSDNVWDYIKKGNEYLGIKENPYLAELMYSKAIEKEPEVLEAHLGRGVARSKQYLYEGALAEFETVTAIINKKKEKMEKVDPVLEARLYQEKGKVLLVKGSYDQALEALRKAKDIQPDLKNIHLNLGDVYFIQKNYDKSKAEFREAARYDSDNPDAYLGLGDTSLAQGKFDEAILAYNKALALDKNNKEAMSGVSDANNKRALAFISEGNYEQAIKIYQDLIKINADVKDDIYFNLGYALAETDRLEEATGAYSKAIKINPNWAAYYNNRGVIYNKLGQDEKALTDYNKAIELDPKDTLIYNNRGLIYDNLGENERALTDYNKAIGLDPEYTSAYQNRGMLYDKLGDDKKALIDYKKAIELYSKAMELNPKDAVAYRNRGILYDNLGEKERALTDYSKAIELNPKDAPAYQIRGVLYDKLGEKEKALIDYNKAIELYSKTIELNPTDAPAYQIRGVIYYKLGQNEKALANYNDAISVNPNYAPLYNSRGVLYGKLEQYDKAMLDYKKATELQPKGPLYFLNLSEVYIFSRNYGDALRNIRQSVSLMSKAEHKVINLYLETISKKLLNIDTTDSESALELMLKQSVTSEWSFNEMESWIKSANVSENIKQYILEKTKLVKETVNPDRRK